MIFITLIIHLSLKRRKTSGSDILRNRLGRVFNTENNLNILERSVMMNMIYFNSDHEIFSLSPEIIEV
jgi:hypothetical protein